MFGLGNEPETHGKMGPSFAEIELQSEVPVRDRFRFPIYWFLFASPSGSVSYAMGLCGYSMKPALTSVNRRRLYVSDLYITRETGCEEAQRCLCNECPLNRTTVETWNRESTKPWTLASFKQDVQLFKTAQAEFPGEFNLRPYFAQTVPANGRTLPPQAQ